MSFLSPFSSLLLDLSIRYMSLRYKMSKSKYLITVYGTQRFMVPLTLSQHVQQFPLQYPFHCKHSMSASETCVRFQPKQHSNEKGCDTSTLNQKLLYLTYTYNNICMFLLKVTSIYFFVDLYKNFLPFFLL